MMEKMFATSSELQSGCGFKVTNQIMHCLNKIFGRSENVATDMMTVEVVILNKKNSTLTNHLSDSAKKTIITMMG